MTFTQPLSRPEKEAFMRRQLRSLIRGALFASLTLTGPIVLAQGANPGDQGATQQNAQPDSAQPQENTPQEAAPSEKQANPEEQGTMRHHEENAPEQKSGTPENQNPSQENQGAGPQGESPTP